MATNNQNNRIGSFAAINGGVIEGCSANVKLRGCPNGAGFVFGNSGVVKNSVSLKLGSGKGVTGFYKRNTGTVNACAYLANPHKRQIDRNGNVLVKTGNPECFLPTGLPSDQVYHKLGLQNLWKNARGKNGFILEPDKLRNKTVLFGAKDRIVSIRTQADLVRIIKTINSGDRAAASANYLLEANLNMHGAKLEPIGLSEALPFSGNFDGNGKTTLDEQYVAYKIYEETIKEENDSSLSYHKPAKYSYTNNNTTNNKGTKGGTIIAVVAVIISLFLLFAKCSSTKRVLDEHLLF